MSSRETNNTKQALWLGIGSLFSFGFAMVSSIILSRYFSKNDFGTYKQVLMVYNTLLVVFTLGLPKAFNFFLPRTPIDEARDLINKITRIFYILGGCFSLFLFLFSNQISDLLKNPDLANAIMWFSPVPMLMLPTIGLESILSTYRKTQFSTVYLITTRILLLICVTTPIIIFEGDVIDSIKGFVIASIISFIMAIYLKYLPVKQKIYNKCKVKYIEIIQYCLPIFYASIWGVIIGAADQFYISRYFGPTVFADFSNGSLELPFVGMITSATSAVLGPVFSRLIFEKANVKTEILPLWISAFEKTVKIIYPLVLFFWFFGDIVMIVIYGNQYQDSGTYFRIKLLVNILSGVSFTGIIMAIKANGFDSIVHMIHAVLVVLLEYFVIVYFHSPYILAIVSVVLRLLNSIIMVKYIAKQFKIPVLKLYPTKIMLKLFIICSISLLVIRFFLISILNLKSLTLLLIAFFMFSFVFLLLIKIFKIKYIDLFLPLFNKKNLLWRCLNRLVF